MSEQQMVGNIDYADGTAEDAAIARLALKAMRRAQRLVGSDKTWTTGVFARDANGLPTYVGYGDGVSFCAAGAYMHSTVEIQNAVIDGKIESPIRGESLYNRIVEIVDAYLRVAISEEYPDRTPIITHINDELGRKAVARVYRRAVALLKARVEG